MTVPARWRHAGMTLLLALPDDLQPALRLMPPAVLQAHLDRVEADPDLSEDERDDKIRFHSSRAFECPLDAQGRLSLPPGYVTALGLKGQVMLIGAHRHIEVWSLEEGEAHFSKLQAAHAAGSLRLKR